MSLRYYWKFHIEQKKNQLILNWCWYCLQNVFFGVCAKSCRYETGNGIKAEETGTLKKASSPDSNDAVIAQGFVFIFFFVVLCSLSFCSVHWLSEDKLSHWILYFTKISHRFIQLYSTRWSSDFAVICCWWCGWFPTTGKF